MSAGIAVNSLKQNFLTSIFESGIDEGPFNFYYKLRTIFFSNEIISLFGEFNEYSHLPHGRGFYEGRTFYKIDGKFREITLNELFTTSAQKEYLRSYCEKELQQQPTTYLSAQEPSFGICRQEDINTFVIDDQFLIIIFQPYTVGSYVDGPCFVKIPHGSLDGHWDDKGIFSSLLNKVIASQSFVASSNTE